MPFTLYDATIGTTKDAIKSLINIISIAEKQPNAESFLNASIHPDMKPLTFQVHVITSFAKRLVARLVLRDAQTLENDIATYADIHARLDAALKTLESVDKDTINTKGETVAPTKIGPTHEFNISGAAWASAAALPNIFFHLVTAYDILRKEGVPLGKFDYLSPFVQHVTASN
ncbi:hypothetical protein PISL3812_08325 [Talaromyces islandicus]|uniref:Helix-turn-helix-domain containing protein type n=1 Tax=Talaromyces islandicus TaxID=28573 RepID=A0A0U1M6V0_TALIS|nr:hypothetical protein PISL3812_08325 [Talaromyces islandicus]